MYTKNLNTFILTASQTLNIAVIMLFAVILARLVWWVVNPTFSEVYMERSSTVQNDDIKFIINRYPFGVIAKEKKAEKVVPHIVDQIKLVGVYVNTQKDSIAFIQIGDKTQTVKIGAAILGNATLKAVNPDSIIVSEGGNDATVSLSSGSGSSGDSNGGSNNNMNSNIPHMRPDARQYNPNHGNNSQMPSTNSDEFKERRRKIVEEFAQHQQSGNSASNSNANQENTNINSNNSSNNASTPAINNSGN